MLLLRTVAVACVALVAGAAFGRFVIAPQPSVVERERLVERYLPQPNGDRTITKFRVLPSYPLDLTQFGSSAGKLADKVRRGSAGTLMLDFVAAPAPAEAERCFDSVASGRMDACWTWPGLWAGKERALVIFGGIPFGPDATEFAAWMAYGGGRALQDEILAAHGMRALFCGIAAAEAGGWFRKPIEAPGDLRGLKLRAFGMAARVYGRVGAEPLHLDGERMLTAIKGGEIDGVEYSSPALDLKLGFHGLLTNYYFPGWHQPTVPLALLINRKAWDAMPEHARALLETACGESVADGLFEGEVLQSAALRELKAKGAVFRRWPEPVLHELEKAWQDIAEQEAQADAGFKRAWTALAAFRAGYETWRKLGQMP
jgi:TRAP-type mannitol/chloroaromatic compound transport system substrate-binding protein